jgi:BirA family biotin operon repressor/biotin-[acetyl-CoA-carboxylase] ligase
VVVGIGINANWPDELPAELVDLATSLNRVTGRPVDRAALLVGMLLGLEARYARLADAGGPAGLASEYRRRCATIGLPVRVELHDETFTGTATDISDEGHLMVSTDACMRTITAGDVVHLRPL